MREQLNSNPIAQVVLIGALLVAAGFFVMSSMGGGGGEGEAGGDVAAVSGSIPGEGPASVGVAASSTAPVPAPPPPRAVLEAYESGATVVLLFVHDGGIDDRLVEDASAGLAGLPGVRTFVVPAARISRYAAIAEGVGVERVPALVVIRPKGRAGSAPAASVSYGFQSGASVVQAVVDAGYRGPSVDYHP